MDCVRQIWLDSTKQGDAGTTGTLAAVPEPTQVNCPRSEGLGDGRWRVREYLGTQRSVRPTLLGGARASPSFLSKSIIILESQSSKPVEPASLFPGR